MTKNVRSPETRIAAVLSLAALGTLLSACTVSMDDPRSEGAVQVSAAAVGTFGPRALAAPPPVTSHCTPAPQVHANALCVCRDLGLSGTLTTRAKKGRAADVGVAGAISLASGSVVEGSVRASGEIASSGSLSVGGHLWSKTGLSTAGELLVTGDLATGGDLTGAGSVDVGGALRVAGDVSFAGSVERTSAGPYEAPAAPPCGCAPEEIYDVAGAVLAARTANDNAAIALEPDALATSSGERELVLPAGRYYLSSLGAAGDVRVRATGDVLLYVDGDVDLAGRGAFAIDDGASLDLFVAGSISVAGEITLGDAARPEAFRLYVGGKDAHLGVAGDGVFRGLVYAPTADVSFAGSAVVDGALFAGSLSTAGSLEVSHAPVTSQTDRCEHPEATPAPEPTYEAPPALR